MLLTIAEFVDRWSKGTEDDVDVYDDVCEELAVCYCGCIKLTREGKKHFKDVLNYTIDVNDSISGNEVPWAIVNVDDEEGVWQEKLKKAKEFFYSAAGYCSDVDYKKWFKEVC